VAIIIASNDNGGSIQVSRCNVLNRVRVVIQIRLTRQNVVPHHSASSLLKEMLLIPVA
jgi:hypothetical protein